LPTRPSIPAATGSAGAPNENAAVASHIQLNGAQFNYTATTGHLTASDVKTGQASVSFFYVAYTVANADAAKRPVIFFTTAAPARHRPICISALSARAGWSAAIPQASIPPVQLVDNRNPAGQRRPGVCRRRRHRLLASHPNTNADFWGVDKDAAAFRDFVQRYVAVNKREASPKFLFGESYGAPRTAVLANLLETAGVQIDGLVLQSAIMDYNSNCGVLDPNAISCEGYIPTYALTSAYHGRAACRWTACAASPPAATAPRLRLTLPAMLRRRPPCSASCPT
jgi:hypothetical protein